MFHKPRWEPSFPLFKSLNILPLRHLYVYKVLRLFYLRGGHNTIRRTITNRSLRTAHAVTVPRTRTEHLRRFITVIAPFIYNKLPTDICNGNDQCKRFSKNLRNWLFSKSDVEDLMCVVV